MTVMNVDLIAVDYGDRKEMSVVLLHDSDRGKDRLLGPAPYKGAVGVLAPMLVEAMPAFTLEAAQNYLTVVHFRNVMAHENSVGVAYPWKVPS